MHWNENKNWWNIGTNAFIPFIITCINQCYFYNERNYVRIKNNNGDELILVQIAGLIARRIVCDIKENEETKQGNKFGMIRFGSRVDLYFENYQLMINTKQKTIAGETIIARKK